MKISGSDMAQNINNMQRAGQTGRRISSMMERINSMDAGPAQEQMTEIKTSLEELNLSEIDLDSMTEEDIAAVAASIHNVMESFKTENMTASLIDINSMSSEEVESYVSDFKNNADEVLSSMGKMEGMMQGKPPRGGKPPAGGKDKNQNAISAYESTDLTEDDEDELTLLESIIEAMETVEASGDETDLSALQELIGEYLY